MGVSPSTPAGLSVRHFSTFVVRDTLARLTGPDTPHIESEAAVELLVGTVAVESGFRALDQITGANDFKLGPAFGLYQIEPATRFDIHERYLRSRPSLNERVGRLMARDPSADHQLVTNLAYATAIARLIYLRSPIKLGAPGDVEAHAWTWKQVYNTPAGKGREEDFIGAWQRLVAGRL